MQCTHFTIKNLYPPKKNQSVIISRHNQKNLSIEYSMSSSYLPSRSSATHRKSYQTSDDTSTAPRHVPDVASAPNPRPIFQFLALGVVIIFGLIQFLPATHFRNPSDPLGNWVPIGSESSSVGLKTGNFGNGQRGDDGMVHVVYWMDCLDLRVLAVLANSTLSSSRQEEVKEIIGNAFSALPNASSGIEEIVPFIIPRVSPFLSKFIYVTASVIMKGKVEELIGVDLVNYAIGAAEDCSEKLKDYVNFDVLHAIQRSASKPWVSVRPFPEDACMPDLTLLLIDARKLQKDVIESIMWWHKVLNLRERKNQKNLAVILALHDKYLKLSSSWLVKVSSTSGMNNDMLIHYDGPKTVCFQSSSGTSQVANGSVWSHYLPPMSDGILGS